MKLLIVSAFAPPHGGGPRVAFDQAKYLRRLPGFAITMVSHEAGFKPLGNEKIEAIVLPGRRVKGDYVITFAGLLRLWKLVGLAEVVLIHSQYFALSVLAALLAHMRGKKTAVIHHGHLLSELRNRWNTRFVNSCASLWLLVDPRDHLFIVRYCKPKPYKIIRNGYDPEILNPLRKPRSGSPLRNFIFCGSLVVDKGMEELVTAIKHFPGVRFGVVGDGPYAALLSSLPNVTLYGRREYRQTLEIMGEYDCLLLPSHHESFGMVVLESLALGRPVISTYLNAQIDSLLDNNGLLIEKRSAEALIHAMEFALKQDLKINDPDKIDKFSWPVVIDVLAQELKTLASA